MLKRWIAFMTVAAWTGVSVPAAVAADAPLADAIRSGNRAAALSLLQQRVNVNATDANGATALHYAAYQEDADLVDRLLKAGAKPSVSNEFGSTPMSEAAAVGNASIIRLLLRAGADVNSPSRDGQTALMAVARTGRVDAAKVLLEAGADVNAIEQWGGQTALMWAAAQKQPAMVRLLVENGAKVNVRGTSREWERRITAEPRPKDLQRGGFSPLLYAAREGCLECARHLVQAGADINLTDPDRTTPLVLSLMNMRFDTAAYLISAGADVDKWDLYGRSPLYAAVDLSTLPRGGRPDIPSTDDTTALQVIGMLLDRGANPNLQLKLRPPYRNVIFDRSGDNLVLTIGATPLLRASKAGDNPEAIRMLLEHGALVNLPNVDGISPLMAAAGMGHVTNATRGRFNTEQDSLAAIPLLLKAGAEINAQAADGQTALHSAAQKGWNKVIALLVEAGADLSIKDSRGFTALDHARGTTGGRGQPSTANPETAALLEKLGSRGR
jgi:ankyrin repeat protein